MAGKAEKVKPRLGTKRHYPDRAAPLKLTSASTSVVKLDEIPFTHSHHSWGLPRPPTIWARN